MPKIPYTQNICTQCREMSEDVEDRPVYIGLEGFAEIKLFARIQKLYCKKCWYGVKGIRKMLVDTMGLDDA